MSVERETLSGVIVREIIGEIAQRRLRAGDEIPSEGELSERHQVNRLVVREAIRVLVARGVLTSSQGRRARVAVPSPAVLGQILEFRLSQNSMDVRDLLDTRRVIEGELARRAAVRIAAGQGSTSGAEKALAAMRESVADSEAFVRGDLAFHQAVADLAASEVFSFLLAALNSALLDARRASYRGRERRGSGQDDTIEAHQRILDAIGSGDGDRAARAMTGHLEETSRDLGLL